MSQSEELQELFLKKKPAKILMTIKRESDEDSEEYALKLARNADTTYSHTVRVLKRMEELDVITFERDGRRKLVHLTPLGDSIAEDLINFWDRAEQFSREKR